MVRAISWVEDDSACISVSADHTMMYWKLRLDPKDPPNPQWTYTKSLISFTSCQVFKEEQEKGPPKIVAIGASGKDGTIREIVEGKDKPTQGPDSIVEFLDEWGAIGSLVIRMTRTVWGKSRVVLLDSGFGFAGSDILISVC